MSLIIRNSTARLTAHLHTERFRWKKLSIFSNVGDT